MANTQSVCVAILCFLLQLHSLSALYEDQVAKFDWKQSFVGKVTQAEFEGRRQVIVATEENVLAALAFETGHILWRHVLEPPADNVFKLFQLQQKDIVTVLGNPGNWIVRSWDAQTGSINNEWVISPETPTNYEFQLVDGQLHVLEKASLLKLSVYDLKNGQLLSEQKIPFSTTEATECVLIKSYYACLQSNNLVYKELKENAAIQTIDLSDIEEVTEKPTIKVFKDKEPAILVTFSAVKSKIIYFKNSNKVVPSMNVMPNAVGVTEDDKQLIFQLEGTTKPFNILIKATDLSTNQDIVKDFAYPQGLGKPDIVSIQCVRQACHLLFSTADDALLLVNFMEGKLLWQREEALAQIVASEFLELPVSELDASIEDEFADNNVVGMFLHRISTQVQQLANFVFGSQHLSKSGLVRDDFGLHKIIVMATKSGKLFGIDTLTGSTAWTYRLPNVRPFTVLESKKMLLFVQRTARYAPAVCALLAEDADSGNGVLFQFDPITGYSEGSVQRLSYKIKQALLLPSENEDHIKPLVVVADGGVFVYPEQSAKLVSNTYLYTIDAQNNQLVGYNIINTAEKLQLTSSWTLNLGSSQIVALSAKPYNERVHSQGRVLPDRSVYYKYVNPNLIALATLTEDPIHKHVLSVYLIDGVSGFIVYSTSHKRAKGPIHLVHSENWLVYSYFSERFRRTEVVAVELYEGSTQSNSTVFSSLAIGQIPQVETQSYILPAFPVTMAVTLTERGITNKFLLFALNSGVIEIPWLLLQPRFADVSCGPEEMCIPYMPEIPLPAEAYINYNHTLGRVGGITVAPAKLESTSHVLVYGLDLFYTRVAPSKTFDLLKEDFDHHLIVLVLFALVAVSAATNYFASQKALKQAWK